MSNQFNSQDTPALNTTRSRNAASPIQKPVFISLLMDDVSTRASGKGDVTPAPGEPDSDAIVVVPLAQRDTLAQREGDIMTNKEFGFVFEPHVCVHCGQFMWLLIGQITGWFDFNQVTVKEAH